MSILAPVLPRAGLKPRVSHHAPYDRTFGPESAELYATTGQVLDPWQADSLDPMLAYRPGGKWVHFEAAEIVGRQNGKGCIGEARVLAGLLLFDERLLLWSAHRYKTTMEAFRRIRGLIEGNDDLSKRIKRISQTNGEECIELHGVGSSRVTGTQRLMFLARSKQSGRGLTGDVNVVDEAFAYTFEQAGALLFTVAAVPNPQFIYLSSPPLESDEGEVLFALRDRAESGTDPSLSYRDWSSSAVDLANLDQVDLDDRELWAASNPAFEGRLPQEQIERERKTLETEPKIFARERLCLWPPRPSKGKSGVIDEKLWLSLLDETSVVGPDVAIAVDIEPNQRNSSISLYGLRSVGANADGRGHTELIAYRPGMMWLIPALVRLKETLNPVAIGLDDKGAGRALLQPLAEVGITAPQDWDKPNRGDLAIPFAADVASAWGAFLAAVRTDAIRHIGQAQYTAAVGNAKTRPLGDAEALARRTSTGDISPLVAGTRAKWAYDTRIDLVREEPEPEAVWL